MDSEMMTFSNFVEHRLLFLNHEKTRPLDHESIFNSSKNDDIGHNIVAEKYSEDARTQSKCINSQESKISNFQFIEFKS